jgi:hypothetical protein
MKTNYLDEDRPVDELIIRKYKHHHHHLKCQMQWKIFILLKFETICLFNNHQIVIKNIFYSADERSVVHCVSCEVKRDMNMIYMMSNKPTINNISCNCEKYVNFFTTSILLTMVAF